MSESWCLKIFDFFLILELKMLFVSSPSYRLYALGYALCKKVCTLENRNTFAGEELVARTPFFTL
jgi:hypothetical protein